MRHIAMLGYQSGWPCGVGMRHYRLHQWLGYRVNRLARLMQGMLEADLEPHRLTGLMWVSLYGIAEDGVETPSQLASYLGVARPSASRVLQRLQGDGLIARIERHGSDARTVQLRLTDAGRRTVAELLPRFEAHEARFMSRLTAEERRVLLAALERLCDPSETDAGRLRAAGRP